MAAKEDTLENLMSHLGAFGRYQCFQVFLNVLGGITAGMHMLALLATAGEPEHRCLVPWLENNGTLPWDSVELTSAIPKEEDGSLSSCLIFNPGTNTSEACNAWVYNTTYYTYTRVTQWSMVCDKRWMLALSQSMYMGGVFVGAATCGSLADMYGRKPVFCWSAFFQVIISIGLAFVNYFPLFLVAQFFYGIVGSAGAFNTAFVLIIESVGPSMRTLCGMLINCSFAIGIMLLSVWGSYITDATTLQLVIGTHSFILMSHWWLQDESPRWLWGQGRISESVNIVAKGVKFNNGPKFDKAEYISKGKAKLVGEETKKATILDIFQAPRLRSRAINIAFCWFANSIAYYGLSLSTNSMEGDPYVNMFIMAAVELPSYALVVLILDRIGRRSLISIFMFIGGGLCFCTAIIPRDMTTLSTVVVFLGKFCISASFGTVGNYTAEVFPTVVRNAGVGFGASCARLAAMLAPAVSLLDSVDKRLPIIIFATLTFISGFFTLFLPETMNQPIPETIEEGEDFGVGDTVFTTGCFPRSGKKDYMPANPA